MHLKLSGLVAVVTGGSLLHVPADLTDPDAPARVITKAIEALGGLDILVNNAGGPARIARTTENRLNSNMTRQSSSNS